MEVDKLLGKDLGYPLLLIGGAVLDFKKDYNGPITRFTSLDEVRDFVAYYDALSYLDRVIVVEDLSFLSSAGEGILLKFIEESPLKVVLLSVFDSVSGIFLSRMRRIVKYQREKCTSEFLKVSSGFKRIEESLSPDTSYYDRMRYLAKISPKLFYVEKKITKNRNRQKIIQFLD